MLYNIIIAPIEFIVDLVFQFSLNKFSSHGVITCVVAVSIVINILALPLYNIADALQEKERKIAKKLEARVKRIKKAFKGDEQFMMLSEYYRQNDYHPLYVLRSSLSILIEIPFFIAAYHYLSNCEALLGSHFWIFKDLGRPDELFKFTIGTKLIIINILPIIMTLINFVSGAVYTKEAPMREKVQLYVVACIFLVLLYNSPSGLVIYWILNNLFSLVKNIVLKMKKPGLILFGFIAVCLCGLTFIFWAKHPETDLWKKEFFTFITVIFCAAPFIISKIKNLKISKDIILIMESAPTKQTFLTFILSSLSLSFFLGFLLSSNVISTSPIEFCNLGKTANPIFYVKSALFFFFGLCTFWPFIIYKMFGNKTKNILTFLFPALIVTCICNSYIFKADYGTLNALFVLTNAGLLNLVPLIFSILSVLITVAVFFFIAFISKTKHINIFNILFISLFIAIFSYSTYKINFINKSAKEYLASHNAEKIYTRNQIKPVYHLSKHKNNVLVIFLDRAMSSFFNYSLKHDPNLVNQFSGFTYYPNTISFGSSTITGYPPMMGGYEYSVSETNKRSDVLLKDKHNEAMILMPRLFSEAGYITTVTDPSFSNYKWKGDLTPFEEYPDITVSEECGRYTDIYMTEKNIDNPILEQGDILCSKQLKNFIILQSLTPVFRTIFYNTIKPKEYLKIRNFIDVFADLYYLSELTDFNSDKPTFTYIGNDSCHEPTSLDPINFEKPEDFTIESLGPNTELDQSTRVPYNVNFASMKQLGKFFDYLKKNNVYDNTRIIIVADHGDNVTFSNFNSFDDPIPPAQFNPLLLVKDFNSKKPLKTDNSFMTNADTLFIAKDGLDVSNINPFTNKELKQDKENGCDIFTSYTVNATYLTDKTQFPYSKENYHVHDNIFDPANWTKLELEGGNK